MARAKFESRLQVWVPTQVAEAFEMLAADGLLAVSDHLRLALSNHLKNLGIDPTGATQQPRPNGPQHQETTHGV